LSGLDCPHRDLRGCSVRRMDEVNSLMREALSFLEAGEPGMAEESYAAAVALAAQHLGDGHPITASLLGHLARSCLEQTGKETFATSLLERQVDSHSFN